MVLYSVNFSGVIGITDACWNHLAVEVFSLILCEYFRVAVPYDLRVFWSTQFHSSYIFQCSCLVQLLAEIIIVISHVMNLKCVPVIISASWLLLNYFWYAVIKQNYVSWCFCAYFIVVNLFSVTGTSMLRRINDYVMCVFLCILLINTCIFGGFNCLLQFIQSQ